MEDKVKTKSKDFSAVLCSAWLDCSILIPCYGLRNKEGQLMRTGGGDFIASMNLELIKEYMNNCDIEVEIIEFEPTLARIKCNDK